MALGQKRFCFVHEDLHSETGGSGLGTKFRHSPYRVWKNGFSRPRVSISLPVGALPSVKAAPSFRLSFRYVNVSGIYYSVLDELI